MPDKQTEANRRNALASTGPNTPEGIEGCKMNASRHGLRALQPVVPGENADEWEAHRAAIVDDLAPHGAMELALAEQISAKLWRLGRVSAYEAVLIANAQAEDELLRAHEMIYQRDVIWRLAQTDIPTRTDVASARQAAEEAARKLTEQAEALGQLQALAAMQDDDTFPNWTLYTFLRDEFRLDKDNLDRLFEGEVESLFRARHARKMISMCFKNDDELDQLREILAAVCSGKLEQLKRDAHNRQAEHERVVTRYEDALQRRRLASGLPDAIDLEKIQRYENHLERGMHKDLDRLHQLKEARGAASRPAARRWPSPWSRRGRRPPRTNWLRSAVLISRPRR